MARPSDRLRAILGRVAADESGTSLTEFVVLLPIFLLIFTGIGQLAQLSHEGIRVKARASRNTWKAARDAQSRAPNGNHLHPRIAANGARSEIQSHDSPNGDTQALNKNAGLARRGTAGEAQSAVRFVGRAPSMGAPSGDPPGSDVDDFPQDIVDDSRRNTVRRGSGALAPFSGSAALSKVAPNPAVAAGTRYGMVVGEDDASVRLAGETYDLSAGYDTLVSPVAVDGTPGELLTIGFSRLAAHDDRCLGGILNIGFEFDYLSNCI